MEQNTYKPLDAYSEDDRKRLSRMLMLSRAQSGLSQEKVALELDIAKKTVQNWEKGVSAPTLPQAIAWFRVLNIPAMPYFLQFMFPEIEGIRSEDSDDKIRKEVINLIEGLPPEAIRQLMFLFYGNHGSSPRAALNLLTAYLQSPLHDRYGHAVSIVEDYKMAAETDTLTQSGHIQPNMDVLELALDRSRASLLDGNESYLI